MYYRQASAAVAVFDICSAESFEALRGWVDELKRFVPKDLVLVVAANKVDLENNRAVPRQVAAEFVAGIDNAMLFETSAKSGQGVAKMFTALAERLAVVQDAQAEAAEASAHAGAASPDRYKSSSSSVIVDQYRSSALVPPAKKKSGCC